MNGKLRNTHTQGCSYNEGKEIKDTHLPEKCSSEKKKGYLQLKIV